MKSPEFLRSVGASVRALRERRGWTRKELSEHCGVSERFLAQLEVGQGNISLARFADVAASLATTPADLMRRAAANSTDRPLALLGVRGSGKSTIGAALAKHLGWRFVELDKEIERTAGLKLNEIFEVHGEGYYRRLEREVLSTILPASMATVIATGGSIVTDPENFALLRARCTTVWLKTTADQLWSRVLKQGDARPMAKKPQAFDELRALLVSREPMYALADHTVDTSKLSITRIVNQLAERERDALDA